MNDFDPVWEGHLENFHKNFYPFFKLIIVSVHVLLLWQNAWGCAPCKVVLLTVPCLSSSIDLALGENQMVAFCLFFGFSYEKNLQIFLGHSSTQFFGSRFAKSQSICAFRFVNLSIWPKMKKMQERTQCKALFPSTVCTGVLFSGNCRRTFSKHSPFHYLLCLNVPCSLQKVLTTIQPHFGHKYFG